MARPTLTTSSTSEETKGLDALAGRRTEEIVVALVGPVGAGVTTTAAILGELLARDYGYKVSNYRVSQIIGASNHLLEGADPPASVGAKRISDLQGLGNSLRERFGPAFLAERCVESIAVARLDDGYKLVNDRRVPTARRHAHIIDSVKNPAEVALLRDVYGDMFWLIAVDAPEEVRRERLQGSGVQREKLDEVIVRDEGEKIGHGQNVTDTVQLADFFIRNDGQKDDRLRAALGRYLDILFNVGVGTPTIDESAMYHAVSAAAKSACLSRAVGAAIYSAEGELISIGWNDVPRFGGGLYGRKAGEGDNRCHVWRDKICYNDHHKKRLYAQVGDRLKPYLRSPDDDLPAVETALTSTDMKNLIEFSRAVHAEMEAILAAARKGASSLVGSTMSVTTFPCHACARHVVASGIHKVVYIEPYAKSLALQLHSDAVSIHEADEGKKLVFLQYEGVAPKNHIRLFKHGKARKTEGKLIVLERRDANPVFQPAMDGFTTHEQVVLDRLKKKLEPTADGQEDGDARGKAREAGTPDAADQGQPQLALGAG